MNGLTGYNPRDVAYHAWQADEPITIRVQYHDAHGPRDDTYTGDVVDMNARGLTLALGEDADFSWAEIIDAWIVREA